MLVNIPVYTAENYCAKLVSCTFTFLIRSLSFFHQLVQPARRTLPHGQVSIT